MRAAKVNDESRGLATPALDDCHCHNNLKIILNFNDLKFATPLPPPTLD